MKPYAVVLTLIAALLLSGCVANSTPTEKLVVGLNYYIGQGPFIVAQKEGFFEEQGIDVEYFWSTDVSVLKSAFVSNQAQIYHFTADSLALDAGNSLEGKIIWVSSSSEGADGIIASNSIQTVSDLSGKKIGYLEGSPTHYMLARVLAERNLTLSDVESVNLDPDKAAEAFFAQELDAAGTWEPWLTKASELSNTKILVSSKETPELILDVFIVRADVLENNPELIAKFIRGIQKGVEYAHAHPEETAQIAAPTFQLSPEEYLEAVSAVDFKTVEDNQRLFAPDGQIQHILTTAGELWEEENLTSSPP